MKLALTKSIYALKHEFSSFFFFFFSDCSFNVVLKMTCMCAGNNEAGE